VLLSRLRSHPSVGKDERVVSEYPSLMNKRGCAAQYESHGHHIAN
jgi:hypothetical protein